VNDFVREDKRRWRLLAEPKDARLPERALAMESFEVSGPGGRVKVTLRKPEVGEPPNARMAVLSGAR